MTLFCSPQPHDPSTQNPKGDVGLGTDLRTRGDARLSEAKESAWQADLMFVGAGIL